MKNKSSVFYRVFFPVLFFVIYLGFFFALRCRALETGPFCDMCELIQLVHLTEEQFNSFKNDALFNIGSTISLLADVDSAVAIVDQKRVDITSYISTMYSDGLISESAYISMDEYIYGLNLDIDLIALQSSINEARLVLNDIRSSLNSLVLTSSEFCISCSASGEADGDGDGEGDGDVDGDGGCCCNCPDYAPILQEMSDRILSQRDYLQSINMNLSNLKDELFVWLERWKLQDEKLMPILDELAPWLEKSKKFYSEYYDSDWGSATWSNLKNIISDITEKETFTKLDRVLTDYVGSSMSSASWSAFDYCLGKEKEIYDYVIGNTTGHGAIKNILKDYADSVANPLSETYTLPSEIPDEKEWMNLNWFQRITAALGVMAFTPTNVSNQVDIDFDQEKEQGKMVENSVVSLSTEVSIKFGTLYGSYKNIFDAFNGIIPGDQLPTSIRIHPGFKFDYNPGGGGDAGDQSAYVLPPLDWSVQETSSFKVVIDLLRGIFGFIWWILGFGITYEIVVGVYGFCVSLTQKTMAVFGSLGRSGGGAD